MTARTQARADRRPQTGRLRVPRRGRLRLPRCGQGRRAASGISPWKKTGDRTPGCSQAYDALLTRSTWVIPRSCTAGCTPPLPTACPAYQGPRSCTAPGPPGASGRPRAGAHLPDRAGAEGRGGEVRGRDLAGDVSDLLGSGARLVRWGEDGQPGAPARDVGPATSGCSCAPTARPPSSRLRCGRPGCRWSWPGR